MVSCQPDVEVMNRVAGDKLIFACDGIWDVMSSEEAAGFYLDAGAAMGKGNIDTICEQMINRCYALGSTDNMSVVCVEVADAA